MGLKARIWSVPLLSALPAAGCPAPRRAVPLCAGGCTSGLDVPAAASRKSRSRRAYPRAGKGPAARSPGLLEASCAAEPSWCVNIVSPSLTSLIF